MVILGVDPGTARLGWGIVKQIKSQSSVGQYGCLQTKKFTRQNASAFGGTKSDSDRLKQLFQDFNKLLKKFKPDAVAVEALFFFKNQKTVIPVAQARGVILLAAALENIPCFSYTPPEIKLAVTGYGKADKSQVQQMMKSILKLDSVPKPDDTADALAVALTHAFSYKMKTRVK